MVSRRDIQKQKKQKQRQQRIKKQQLDNAAKRREIKRQRLYPEITFVNTNDADPTFVKLVQDAASKINFESSHFEEYERDVFKALKSHGAYEAQKILEEYAAEVKYSEDEGKLPANSSFFFKFLFYHKLPQLMMDAIPSDQLIEHIPYNDYTCYFEGNHICIEFTSLQSVKGNMGTCWYSRKKPTIQIDGEEKIVAFSQHAIERICERIKGDRWQSLYTAYGDVFAYLNSCCYFERRDLYKGQLGFTFYDACYDKEFAQFQFFKKILDTEKIPPNFRAYYRMGYCPAVIEGDFIKAKTLLYPGYKSTPEYGLLLGSNLPRNEKAKIQDFIQQLDGENMYDQEYIDIMKWYHDNGVPQVVRIDQKVYDYSTVKSKTA